MTHELYFSGEEKGPAPIVDLGKARKPGTGGENINWPRP